MQENVSAIRVVKSFVREGFENEKYTKARQSLYDQFVNAESRLSFNNLPCSPPFTAATSP